MTAGPGVIDRAVSVGLVGWAVLEAATLGSSTPAPLRLAFALAVTVPLARRDRAPATAAIWAFLALVVQEVFDVLSYEAVTPYQCLPLATFVLVASVRRPRQATLLAVGLSVVYPFVLLGMDEDGTFRALNAVGVFLTQVIIVLVGLLVRARRLEALATHEGLQAAAVDESERLAAARQQERERIARELGVMVAIDLERMERHLRTATIHLEGTDPDAVARDCGEVQRTAARAVGEMRRLLQALRVGDEASSRETGPPIAAEPRTCGARTADAVVVVAMAGILAAETAAMPDGRLAVACLSAVLLVLVPVALRRRYPVAVAAVLTGGFVARELLGVLAHLPTTLMPALLVGGYAVGAFASTPRRTAVGGALLLVGGTVVSALLIGDGGQWPDLPVVAFLVGSSLTIGQLVRESEGHAVTLRATALQWAADRGRRREAALEREREAVARDLHDVVAHGLSLVGVQAGAAAATAGRNPAAASGALAVATAAATETRQQLSSLADLLGPGDPLEPRAAGEVEALVAGARDTGQAVALEVGGDLAALPVEVGMAVYRIVQESLTNARKHASGGEVEVRLGAGSGEATVEVRSWGGRPDPAMPGTGNGIAGMRERARLLGGTLTAGPGRQGEFVVRAELPVGAWPLSEARSPLGSPATLLAQGQGVGSALRP